jgi:chromosomal replication initiator protein
MDKVWKEVLAALKKRIQPHSYRMWIDPLVFSGDDEGAWTITCPNAFSKKRVQEHFGELIHAELKRVLKDPGCRLAFAAGGRRKAPNAAGAPREVQLALPGAAYRPSNGRLLRRDFTFDQFVVGANNDFAYSAALSLATRPERPQAALFLLSATGLGKSHLSQAIGHHILSERPEKHVYYMTAEDFSNEMVQAYRQDALDKFKLKYRNLCDVLLLEDVHCLSGKERTQIELAATLDTLFEGSKRIIFSSCYLPGDIPKLNDKLRSRFASSLISAIDPPNFRTRLRILKKKAEVYGYAMPEPVLHFLAAELVDDIRQLESGLNGVAAKSSLLGLPIDLPLAESVVKNIVNQRRKITVELIKKLICTYYNVSVEDLVSRSRKQGLVRPRQMAIYLSRRFTDSPLQAIGKSFNRFHATALHSINCIEQAMKEDPSTRQQVEFFRQKLESGKYELKGGGARH